MRNKYFKTTGLALAAVLFFTVAAARPAQAWYRNYWNPTTIWGDLQKTDTPQNNENTQRTDDSQNDRVSTRNSLYDLLRNANSQPEAAPEQTDTPGEMAQQQTPTPAPAPAQAVQGLTADEQQMLNLVNKERTSCGLRPLQLDMDLVKIARLKSKDMIDNNYFSHQSPTYGSPFDMMASFGIPYRTAGENIAGSWSVEDAHRNLMNSDGHRKNILNPNFTHIGIGIVDGGPYGKMFTQMFVGR